MKVVIYTNVMLNAIFPNSKNYWIWEALLNREIHICVTSDILNEYEEIFEQFYDSLTAILFLDTLEILPNLIFIRKYYFWNLIIKDPDDNKFVDCAVASGSDYLVSNDKHFNVLKDIDFPKVFVLTETEFKKVFNDKKNDTTN